MSVRLQTDAKRNSLFRPLQRSGAPNLASRSEEMTHDKQGAFMLSISNSVTGTVHYFKNTNFSDTNLVLNSKSQTLMSTKISDLQQSAKGVKNDATARSLNLNFNLLWPWSLISWPLKLIVLCPCSVDHLCHVASKLVNPFSKYHLHNPAGTAWFIGSLELV